MKTKMIKEFTNPNTKKTKTFIVVYFVFVLIIITGISCNPERTKSHAGVDIKLISITRVEEYRFGNQVTTPNTPDLDIAVVKLAFKASSSKQIKLPAKECELITSGGESYNTDTDWELTLGNIGNTMTWDLVFAVPRKEKLETLRLASAKFKLGGIRELDPDSTLNR